jgi:hypothetical protein
MGITVMTSDMRIIMGVSEQISASITAKSPRRPIQSNKRIGYLGRRSAGLSQPAPGRPEGEASHGIRIN